MSDTLHKLTSSDGSINISTNKGALDLKANANSSGSQEPLLWLTETDIGKGLNTLSLYESKPIFCKTAVVYAMASANFSGVNANTTGLDQGSGWVCRTNSDQYDITLFTALGSRMTFTHYADSSAYYIDRGNHAVLFSTASRSLKGLYLDSYSQLPIIVSNTYATMLGLPSSEYTGFVTYFYASAPKPYVITLFGNWTGRGVYRVLIDKNGGFETVQDVPYLESPIKTGTLTTF